MVPGRNGRGWKQTLVKMRMWVVPAPVPAPVPVPVTAVAAVTARSPHPSIHPPHRQR